MDKPAARHDHRQHQSHGEENIAIAFFLNLFFTIIEMAGGIFTNSVAIQSDALHDAGDTLSIGLAWYFQRLAKKGVSKEFTYGFRRFNTLGAVITGMVLLAGSVYILAEAVPRFFDPEAVDAKGMIWLAVLGVLFNGAAVIKLRKGTLSLNEKMIGLHLMEDVLGWLVVLIGSVIMYFFEAPWIDPLLSVLITLYILKNLFVNLRRSFRIFLQAIPDNYQLEDIKVTILSIAPISDVHHLHLWSLDGEYHLFSAHVVVPAHFSMEDIKPLRKAIKVNLQQQYHIEHVTLDFEMENECISQAI